MSSNSLISIRYDLRNSTSIDFYSPFCLIHGIIQDEVYSKRILVYFFLAFITVQFIQDEVFSLVLCPSHHCIIDYFLYYCILPIKVLITPPKYVLMISGI